MNGYFMYPLLMFLTNCQSRIEAETKEDYLTKRNAVLQAENKQRTGGEIVLNEKESKVNKHLLQLKNQEYALARLPGGIFPPALHFFKAKPYIEKSEVFKIIKLMPKGSVLHMHEGSMADIGGLIKYATYLPECYTCFDEHGTQLFHFYKNPPTGRSSSCHWVSVASARKRVGDPNKFDNELYRNLTLIVDNPEVTYPSQDAVWSRFQTLFTSLFGLMSYAPVFKDYFMQTLQELYDDNVQYMEFRGLILKACEINGSCHDLDWSVTTYQNIIQQFRKDHPDFMGAKIIYSTSRGADNKEVLSTIKDAVRLKERYPNFVVGYDLVGQEDPGHTLLYFLDDLLYPQQQQTVDLPYFFHAGETNWEGEGVDENVIDALLLNSTRIGHGYALLKHPWAVKMAREKGVPIEVNPISNQVLGLVKDLRNHPATEMLATGFPMVISSDDPALWGAKGVSYDFYEAFMGLGGAKADLATLKKLAMDSIKYSALTDAEKQKTITIWQQKWDTFLDTVIRKYHL